VIPAPAPLDHDQDLPEHAEQDEARDEQERAGRRDAQDGGDRGDLPDHARGGRRERQADRVGDDQGQEAKRGGNRALEDAEHDEEEQDPDCDGVDEHDRSRNRHLGRKPEARLAAPRGSGSAC
jgi:hypothetical protein